MELEDFDSAILNFERAGLLSQAGEAALGNKDFETWELISCQNKPLNMTVANESLNNFFSKSLIK